MLTHSQRIVIAFIRAYIAQYGYPPSLRDIGQGVNLSKTAVHYHVDNLCDLGVLSKKRNSPRCLTINEDIQE